MAEINSPLQIFKSYIKMRLVELTDAAFTANLLELEYFHKEPGAEDLKWKQTLSDLRKHLLVNRTNECLRIIHHSQPFGLSDGLSWSENIKYVFQSIFSCKRPINWNQVILFLEYMAESMAQFLPSHGLAAIPAIFDEFDKHLTDTKVHMNQTVSEWWCSKGKDLLEKFWKHQKEKPKNQLPTSTLQFRNTFQLEQHHELTQASVDLPATNSAGLQTTSTGPQTPTSLTADENFLPATDGSPMLNTEESEMVVGARSPSLISMGEPSPTLSGSPLQVVSKTQPLQTTETRKPLAWIVKKEPLAEPTQKENLLGDDVKTCGKCGYTRPYRSYVRLVKCWKKKCETWLCTIDNCPFLSSPGCLANLLEHIVKEHCACAMPGYCIVCGDTKPKHSSQSKLKCRCKWFICPKSTCSFASPTFDEMQVHLAQSRH